MELEKIQAFLQNGLFDQQTSAKDLHVLRGYKPNTLISYNAAVKKLTKSIEANSDYL